MRLSKKKKRKERKKEKRRRKKVEASFRFDEVEKTKKSLRMDDTMKWRIRCAEHNLPDLFSNGRYFVPPSDQASQFLKASR